MPTILEHIRKLSRLWFNRPTRNPPLPPFTKGGDSVEPGEGRALAGGPFKPALLRLAWLVGTGLGSGLAPIAPATVGSLAALVVYFFAPVREDSLALYLLIGAGFLVGVWATGRLASPTRHDPRHAVWDEFVGMWATCLLLPKSLPWMLAAFFCFRVLDVLKPWPIRRLERLPGGLGIMADDLLAGLFGAALLNGLRLAFF